MEWFIPEIRDTQLPKKTIISLVEKLGIYRFQFCFGKMGFWKLWKNGNSSFVLPNYHLKKNPMLPKFLFEPKMCHGGFRKENMGIFWGVGSGFCHNFCMTSKVKLHSPLTSKLTEVYQRQLIFSDLPSWESNPWPWGLKDSSLMNRPRGHFSVRSITLTHLYFVGGVQLNFGMTQFFKHEQ